MFQRPKRASFISTKTECYEGTPFVMFQRPKRASFISTMRSSCVAPTAHLMFQRPKRASFISTFVRQSEIILEENVSTP